MTVSCSKKKLRTTWLTQSNQGENQGKSLQIPKSPFRGAPHIHRDRVMGKRCFSSKEENRITENSIMVESLGNKDMVTTQFGHKQDKKIW